MGYKIVLSPQARKDLRRFYGDVHSRLVIAIEALSANPRPPGCLKLAHSDEWRIRVGDYRIRYLIDDARQEVTVTRIRHRKDVYNR